MNNFIQSEKDKAKEYFENVVKNYLLSDLKQLLLYSKDIGAGPLLVTTVNTIDILGGVVYGFDKGSEKRSKDFIINHLRLPKQIASILYKCVRCGLDHQGYVKGGILFTTNDVSSEDQGNILFRIKSPSDPVIKYQIYVKELTKKVIESIGKMEDKDINYAPEDKVDSSLEDLNNTHNIPEMLSNNAYSHLPPKNTIGISGYDPKK